MIAVATNRDRIVKLIEGGTETYIYQNLEDDLGGGKRWVEHDWNLEQLAFGFAHGWDGLYPLWPSPFFGNSDRFRQPKNEADIFCFDVPSFNEDSSHHYRVAFGVHRPNSRIMPLAWEHRAHGSGGIWVGKHLTHLALGDMFVELNHLKNHSEIIQVLLKLRVILEKH